MSIHISKSSSIHQVSKDNMFALLENNMRESVLKDQKRIFLVGSNHTFATNTVGANKIAENINHYLVHNVCR